MSNSFTQVTQVSELLVRPVPNDAHLSDTTVMTVIVMLASHQEEGKFFSQFKKPVKYMGISEIHDSKDLNGSSST